MAQALRKIELDAVEQLEPQAVQVAPRKVAATGKPFWMRSLAAIGMVAVCVALAVAYIGGHAHIARYDFQRQALQAELQQLEREHVALMLEHQRLSAQPHMVQIARVHGLEVPTADRVQYAKVTELPRSLQSTPATPAEQTTWTAQLRQQFAASVTDALQRLRGGVQTASAYAHE